MRLSEKVHLPQNRAEHRKRGDTDADCDREGEPEGFNPGPELRRIVHGDPQSGEQNRRVIGTTMLAPDTSAKARPRAHDGPQARDADR